MSWYMKNILQISNLWNFVASFFIPIVSFFNNYIVVLDISEQMWEHETMARWQNA